MKLDLSKLGIETTEGEISHVTANKAELPGDPAKATEKAPQEATGEALGSDPAADPVEVVRQIKEEYQGTPEGLEKLQTAAERRKQDLQRYREAYKEYQDNIKRAGMLREEITLGARAGTNPATLLLQAVECIAAMTGEAYYFTNFKAIMDKATA